MINIDADIRNADWIKRTPDKFADLIQKYDPTEPRNEKGRWTKGGQAAVVDAVAGMHKLSELLSLPRAQFVTPDGGIYRGPSGANHEDAAKSVGLTIEDVIKAGVMRVVVHGGKVEGFSVGGPITHEQADLVVGLAQDTIAVDVLTGTPEDPNADGGKGYESRTFEDRRVRPDVVRQWVNNHFVQSVAKQEHDFGNTQIEIAPTSSAALSLNAARNMIHDEHLMATGKDVDPNHVTVRFGLLDDATEVDALRSYIAGLTPFEASVGEIELFPASEHSDGAVPVVARILSPELRLIEAEIGNHANFKDKNFPEYKPHCTLAYVDPLHAPVYADLFVHGTFIVQSITISHASGVKETIPFGMAQKWDPNQPRDQKGRWSSASVGKALIKAGRVTQLPTETAFLLPDGTRVSAAGYNQHAKLAMAAGYNDLNDVIASGIVRYIPGVGVEAHTLTEEQARIIVDDWKTEFAGPHGWNALQVDLIGEDDRGVFGTADTNRFDRLTVDGLLNFVNRRRTQKWDEAEHPRDEKGKFSESFHGTSVGTVEGIKAKGLLASKNLDHRGRPDSVYVTTDEDRAHYYGVYQGSWSGGEYAIVKAEIPIEYWEKHAIEDEKDEQGDGNSFRFEQDIPLEWIKSIETIGDGGQLKKIEHYDGKQWKTTYESKTAKGEVKVVYVPVKLIAQKKDPVSGRYVTPFVSFDKQGDEQLRMIASLNSSRLATWGFTAEAEVLGMARYKLTAVLDGRTSKFCRLIDGTIFEVSDARRKVIEALNVQDPNDLKMVQPWPKQTKAALAEFAKMTPEELTEKGLHIPPYHPHCRTICRPVSSSIGDLKETVPTIPAETETFQAVTAADLEALGLTEVTQEQVDQWNTHIGMTPTELLSKFTGTTPSDVMTKGKGLGSKPIAFAPTGEIGFNVKGADPQGVEFKLGAILEPFTGTYYLSYAQLLEGSPKAQVAFLKQVFKGLIEMGMKSSATEIAVGVAGNAPYYARMGFLPDELAWDDLREYTALHLDSAPLNEVLASLMPGDRQLVEHLLQDKSVGALQALVELPFTYQGRTIGEWLFGDVAGTWSLDLTDDLMVEQAKAYLE